MGLFELTGGLLQISALFIFIFITSSYPDKRIKNNKMGTACGIYRGRRGVRETRVEESTGWQHLSVSANIVLNEC
jgi:hypothetical protein